MSTHTIRDYKDAEGKWRWSISVTPGTPSGTEPDVIADSGQGYANKKDMLNSLFGIFFGDYDETFLGLYAQWRPNDTGEGVPSSQVVGDDVPSVEEQVFHDGRVGVPAPDGIHDGGVTDDD